MSVRPWPPRPSSKPLPRRPAPYGYQLADAGLHPNPARAIDGKRLHILAIDQPAAAVVKRMFRLFIAGRGIFGIAEGLTRDGIPCPSAHDPGRNRHRCGLAWSKGAVRAILINPRYTGGQVWNRQRKDEVLLDINDVSLGHITKMRWNEAGQWIYSDQIVHPPIVSAETFGQAQDVLAAWGRGPCEHKPHARPRDYSFAGAVICGVCQRRMQGQWVNQAPYYRCRFPSEAIKARIAGASTKMDRFKAAIGAGADPAEVAAWINEARAQRIGAEAELRQLSTRTRMTRPQVEALISEVKDIAAAMRGANPEAMADACRKLGLQLTYHPDKKVISATACPQPDNTGKWFVSEVRAAA